LIKAKIYKHLKDFSHADHWANFARKLDLADRYLNNKGIKYSLHNNKIQEADTLIKLFLRDASDNNVHDLQTIWFEIQVAKAHLRQNEFGPGLRQLKFVEKHFNDMYEDQVNYKKNRNLMDF
jgi:peptide alpha-N-acetyltransferase